jgi:hypothetical protein
MRSFWARIPQEVKFAALSLVVVSAAMVLLKEPPPSTQTPSPVAKTTPQTVPTPPLELPNTRFPEVLPSSLDPLPQISPSLEGLKTDPLGLNPSPLPTVPLPDSLTPSSPSKSLDLPLSVTPSPGKIPNQKLPKGTESTREPSSSATVPVIPPDLLSPSPVPLPSSLGAVGDNKAPSTEALGKKTNTNKSAIVAEVRNYFKGGWKAPSNLNKELKYSVVLNADGTIDQILPLGNDATQYIDRTNIPLPGNSLASPVEGGTKTGILLVFRPNGSVTASLEEVDLPSSSSKSPGENSSTPPGRETRP